MLVLGSSTSDSRLPSKKALTCHSKFAPIWRAYPKICPLFQTWKMPTFLKPSDKSICLKRSTFCGEIESKISCPRKLLDWEQAVLDSSAASAAGSSSSIVRNRRHVFDSANSKSCTG